MAIKRQYAKRWCKCSSCGEQIRPEEPILKGDDRKVYCTGCERLALLNNPDDEPEYDCEAGLRMREEYAAYHAAGCTHAFWDDLSAGYIR